MCASLSLTVSVRDSLCHEEVSLYLRPPSRQLALLAHSEHTKPLFSIYLWLYTDAARANLAWKWTRTLPSAPKWMNAGWAGRRTPTKALWEVKEGWWDRGNENEWDFQMSGGVEAAGKQFTVQTHLYRGFVLKPADFFLFTSSRWLEFIASLAFTSDSGVLHSTVFIVWASLLCHSNFYYLRFTHFYSVIGNFQSGRRNPMPAFVVAGLGKRGEGRSEEKGL